ncbi:MAG: ATP-binding cassette domain-containing protein [Thiotrichales bacterium]|nr:ATP-binding cassette domain-containing protein [Thiotrichales bacterium]
MPENSHQQLIEVDRLASHYGDHQVLQDISLAVGHNEIHVIMGASGSGKSTLLKHLLGLKAPTRGCIRILGQDITAMSRDELFGLRKKIGVAFQGGALFSSMSLIENVELPLHEHTDLDKHTIDIMARMKLEMMNLLGYEHLMPAELSGGMLKRAGLARAVVMDPRLLFFDEPSSGLDPVTSAELDDLIRELRNALHMTIVVITHDMDSALNIADRLTVLHHGKQIFTGSVDELKDSDDTRIINMLNRKPAEHDIDSDEYLEQLTR